MTTPSQPPQDHAQMDALRATYPFLATLLQGTLAESQPDWAAVQTELYRYIEAHCPRTALTACQTERNTLRDTFLAKYGDGITLQQWAIERPRLVEQLTQADALAATHQQTIARLTAELHKRDQQLELIHQTNVNGIRDAAQQGRIVMADSTVVDYLTNEISALFPELGVEDAFVSDRSHVTDFPTGETLPQKYLWQVAIDRLRQQALPSSPTPTAFQDH